MTDAVILLGGLWSKQPGLLEAARAAELCPLVLDEDDRRTRRELELADHHGFHPLHLIQEHRLLDRVGVVAVAQAVREWAGEYRIRGIHALREEFVESAGVAAALLGLPGPGLTATRVCRNKSLQRLFFPQFAPLFRRVHAPGPISIPVDWYPVVVKPINRCASLGVQVCPDSEALEAKLASHPPEEELLVESFVSGQEVSVEALVQGGRTVFSGITLKSTTQPDSDYCVEISHTLGPGILAPPSASAVLAANEEVLQGLEFRDGLSHAEYIIDNDGRTVHLVEIAARNPGDSILSMYHLATGTPIEPTLLDVVLGVPTSYGPLRRYVRQRYLTHGTGQLVGVDVVADLPTLSHTTSSHYSPVWLRETGFRPPVRAGTPGAPAALREVLVEKLPGQEVGPWRNSMDRPVSVLFDAPDRDELDTFDHELDAAIRVCVASAGTAG
ncbi:MAG: ATP-grasp domain-containing protein [Dermatophilaceae bacterium]